MEHRRGGSQPERRQGEAEGGPGPSLGPSCQVEAHQAFPWEVVVEAGARAEGELEQRGEKNHASCSCSCSSFSAGVPYGRLRGEEAVVVVGGVRALATCAW